VAAVPVAAPAPAPAPAPAGPDRLAIGKSNGFFQPSALIQIWGFYSDEPTPTSTFRVRRAEVKIKGDISPGLVGYTIMFDPSKLLFSQTTVPVTGTMPPPMAGESAGSVSVLQPGADRAVLQDAYITFQSEYADVSIGQFKMPVSLEGYGSAAKLLFPERALVARAYGDKRDLGLRVEKKLGDYFYYLAGVWNGTGLNRLDEDNEKDVGLRLEAYPVSGLTIGAVGYTTVGERDGLVRDRVEGDLRYDANDVFVIGEYIHGWDGAKVAQTPGAEPSRAEGHGVYGGLGYTFVKRIQPIVRVGMLDPNLDVSGNRTAHYEFGMNYYLRAQEARISLAASAFDPQQGNTRWEGILAAQASF
jgi:hypothetical protein